MPRISESTTERLCPGPAGRLALSLSKGASAPAGRSPNSRPSVSWSVSPFPGGWLAGASALFDRSAAFPSPRRAPSPTSGSPPAAAANVADSSASTATARRAWKRRASRRAGRAGSRRSPGRKTIWPPAAGMRTSASSDPSTFSQLSTSSPARRRPSAARPCPARPGR